MTPTSFTVLDHVFELNPITIEHVTLVRVATGLPLTNLLYSEDDKSPPRLNVVAETQPDLFAQMMWQLCKQQARGYGITKAEVFIEAMFQTEAAVEAEKALACAIPFSFQDPKKFHLQTLLANHSKALIEFREGSRVADAARIEAMLAASTLSKNSPTNSPAGSESTPDPTPSPNSGECSAESKSTTTSN
jgi:hypothetical protein